MTDENPGIGHSLQEICALFDRAASAAGSSSATASVSSNAHGARPSATSTARSAWAKLLRQARAALALLPDRPSSAHQQSQPPLPAAVQHTVHQLRQALQDLQQAASWLKAHSPRPPRSEIGSDELESSDSDTTEDPDLKHATAAHRPRVSEADMHRQPATASPAPQEPQTGPPDPSPADAALQMEEEMQRQLDRAAAACHRAMALVPACTCQRCDRLLSGPEVAVAGDQYFHLDCLRCINCRRALRQERLLMTPSGLSCLQCAPPCTSCGKQLQDNYVTCLEKPYHAACLRCSVCSRALITSRASAPGGDSQAMPVAVAQIYAREGRPACGRCVETVFPRRNTQNNSEAEVGGGPDLPTAAPAAAVSDFHKDLPSYEAPRLTLDPRRHSQRFTIYNNISTTESEDDTVSGISLEYARIRHMDHLPAPSIPPRQPRLGALRHKRSPDSLLSSSDSSEAEDEEDEGGRGGSPRKSQGGKVSSRNADQVATTACSPPAAHYSSTVTNKSTTEPLYEVANSRPSLSLHDYETVSSASSPHSEASSRLALSALINNNEECNRLIDFCSTQPGMLEPLLLWMDLEQFAALPASTSADEVARAARSIIRKYVNSSGDLPVALAWHVRHRAASAVAREAAARQSALGDEDRMYEVPVPVGEAQPETRELILDFAEMRFAVRRLLERQVLPAYLAQRSATNQAHSAHGPQAAVAQAQTSSKTASGPLPHRDASSAQKGQGSSKPLTPSASKTATQSSTTAAKSSSTFSRSNNSRSDIVSPAPPHSVQVVGVESRYGFEWRRPHRRHFGVYTIRVQPASAEAGPYLQPAKPYFIYRRYRECLTLQQIVAARRAQLTLPHFPGKFERASRGLKSLRDYRVDSLGAYLAAVAALPECWAMPAVRDFFQPRLDDTAWQERQSRIQRASSAEANFSAILSTEA